MKRAISIVLLLLTLFTNSFVKASLHYCGETITQIAFGNTEDTEPCDCAETGNMDCCKDIVLKLKPFNDSVRNANLHIEPISIKCLVFLLPNSSLIELAYTSKPKISQQAEPPPLLQQHSDFLSVYRI
jgi:hypothetical protein